MPGNLSLPENCLTPAEVASRCGVALATVYNWIKKGLTVRGRAARLAAVRVGWGLRVGEEALAEFLAALNGGAKVELAGQRTRRQRQAEAAHRKALEMCGVPRKK